MAILPFSDNVRPFSSQPSTSLNFSRRNGNIDQSGPSQMGAIEASVLAIVLAVIFCTGIAMILCRRKRDARQQRTVEAARKRAGKKRAAPIGPEFSARRPQAHLSPTSYTYAAMQPAYLKYWNEGPVWTGTLLIKDGIKIGSICGCEECLKALDGFS